MLTKSIFAFFENNKSMTVCSECLYFEFYVYLKRPENPVPLHKAIECGLLPICSKCGIEGEWLPIGEQSIEVSHVKTAPTPSVTISGLNKLSAKFNRVEIYVQEKSFNTPDTWNTLFGYNTYLNRANKDFPANYNFELKTSEDRLKNNDYRVSVLGYGIEHLDYFEIASFEFKFDYQGDFPEMRETDMIVYRVVGGGAFGGYGETCWRNTGYRFNNSAVFCTPNASCAKEMVEASQRWAQQSKVPNRAKVLVIQASRVRNPHDTEKFGHSVLTDEDEMILVEGVVVDVLDSL